MRFAGTDPDFRRDPKTNLYCAVCQRDIKGDYREAYLVDSGFTAVHPDDVEQMTNDIGHWGWCPIGPECAKKIGLEFTRPTK